MKSTQANLADAVIMVHGGAGTPISRTPVLQSAVEAGWKSLQSDGAALDAVLAATIALEDEPSLNAGTGSNIRMDGETVQMDASIMDQSGDFGAVAIIERVKNPVLVARQVMRSPHLVVAGEGAISLARQMGLPDYDPRTTESLQRFAQLRELMRTEGLGEGWKDFDWKAYWNFPKPLASVLKPNDTVGAVARDGRGGYAAALSTGGTSITLKGRVGDVPVMGAGLYAGPAGAVATTGWGEYIIRENLARRVYDWIAEGMSAKEAVTKGITLFPSHIGVGIIAVGKDDSFASSNSTMAWSGIEGGQQRRADDGS